VPIDFASAALGGDIEVPTLNGKFKITSNHAFTMAITTR
jgi:DnaJ-class molecular chaperone